MTTFIVIGLAGVAIASIVAFVVRRSQRGRGGDLGEVSSQWLIEHRLARATTCRAGATGEMF